MITFAFPLRVKKKLIKSVLKLLVETRKEGVVFRKYPFVMSRPQVRFKNVIYMTPQGCFKSNDKD